MLNFRKFRGFANMREITNSRKFGVLQYLTQAISSPMSAPGKAVMAGC